MPESQSLSSGQVLTRPYSFEEGRIVVQEMADGLSMDLVRKGLLTDQVVLNVSYDIENLSDPERSKKYKGPIVADWYGRQVPKGVHGSQNLGRKTASTSLIMGAVRDIYDRIVDKNLLVRRFNIAVMHIVPESEADTAEAVPVQLDLFTDYEALEREKQAEEAELEKERSMQKALLSIKDKYGKNAIVKGLNMQEGATAMERNKQVGGHKA